jgi:hypothetical protein
VGPRAQTYDGRMQQTRAPLARLAEVVEARSLRAWLTAPVDAAGLVAFRVAFGVLMVGQSIKFLRSAHEHWLAPRVLFPYEGFEWVRPWPGVGLHLHCALMGFAALGVAAGVRARACAAAFGALFAYTVLLDQTHYNNHYYLLVLLSGLLTVVASTRGAAPRWHVLLLQAQLLLVYAYAGVAKLNPDWLAGEPLRHWLGGRAEGSLAEPLLRAAWTPLAISWAGAAFDLSIAPLLVWRRTRSLALAAASAFHLTNAFLFDIGVFPWLMLASAALFLPPEVVRRLVRVPAPGPLPVVSRRRETACLVAAGLYLLVQAALPLRHWLYPGDVAWSEEGHRFAWRMKLRDKQVDLSMVARDAQGREWPIDLDRWVTPRQRAEASSRPLLIWQLARRVREDLEAMRGEQLEVFVRARGRLNFRPREQDLIDPRVDLSRAPYGAFEAAPWIVALKDE